MTNLRIEQGNPTPEELAVVLSVLAQVRPTVPTAASQPVDLWARRSRMMRPALRPGSDAWRGSMMPR